MTPTLSLQPSYSRYTTKNIVKVEILPYGTYVLLVRGHSYGTIEAELYVQCQFGGH